MSEVTDSDIADCVRTSELDSRSVAGTVRTSEATGVHFRSPWLCLPRLCRIAVFSIKPTFLSVPASLRTHDHNIKRRALNRSEDTVIEVRLVFPVRRVFAAMRQNFHVLISFRRCSCAYSNLYRSRMCTVGHVLDTRATPPPSNLRSDHLLMQPSCMAKKGGFGGFGRPCASSLIHQAIVSNGVYLRDTSVPSSHEEGDTSVTSHRQPRSPWSGARHT